jgi:GDP-D-mannose dehydratase
VEQLLGDPPEARPKLGWHHKITFTQRVSDMVATFSAVHLASVSKEAFAIF